MERFLTVVFIISFLAVQAQSSSANIADSLYATGNYTKAINEYAKEGSQRSDLQVARAYNAIGNYKKAILQYQSVTDENPDWQIAGFELGKLLIKTKAYDEAGKLFSQLVVLGKDNPEFYYYLGEAYRKLEQHDSSLIAYKNALEEDSTHLRSLFQLGKYYLREQETKQALTYIEKGLEVHPEDVAMVNLKALALFNDGAYEKAIPWFERVLEMGEHKQYVYEKLAYSYDKEWDFEKAKENYKIALGFDEHDSEIYFSLAEAYRKNKQLDSAEISIKKGIDVQRPIFAKGYSLLAGLARERNDLKAALEYYKLAYKEGPEDAMGYYQICTVADQYYRDPKVKLDYYETFKERYGRDNTYFLATVTKRISELKREIQFSKD